MIDEAKLKERLLKLSPSHQVAFAASICERMLPNYRAFWLIERWGDYQLFADALEAIWRFTAGEPLSEEYLRETVWMGNESIPDSDDFTGGWTAVAQDLASVILYTLKYCIAYDTNSLVLSKLQNEL